MSDNKPLQNEPSEGQTSEADNEEPEVVNMVGYFLRSLVDSAVVAVDKAEVPESKEEKKPDEDPRLTLKRVTRTLHDEKPHRSSSPKAHGSKADKELKCLYLAPPGREFQSEELLVSETVPEARSSDFDLVQSPRREREMQQFEPYETYTDYLLNKNPDEARDEEDSD